MLKLLPLPVMLVSLLVELYLATSMKVSGSKVVERRMMRVIPSGRLLALPKRRFRLPAVSRSRLGLRELLESGVAKSVPRMNSIPLGVPSLS